MKKTLLLLAALGISTVSFAYATSSPINQALGSAWKSYSTLRPQPSSSDITIVYGGADISRKPTLVPHTTTA